MDKKDVEDFVKMYAVNSDTFNYDAYMQGSGVLGASPAIIMP
jgi:hypothetical protein